MTLFFVQAYEDDASRIEIEPELIQPPPSGGILPRSLSDCGQGPERNGSSIEVRSNFRTFLSNFPEGRIVESRFVRRSVMNFSSKQLWTEVEVFFLDGAL